MKINIGYSPCPNDTYIFAALANGWIDTQGLEFVTHLADVETLNQWAYTARLDVTKISFNAFLDLSKQYQLFDSGSALGRNCGPLLVTKQKSVIADLRQTRVAIPGEKTTANFLLDFYHPDLNKKIMTFDQIEAAILMGDVDAGVIIHENRFTYADQGLELMADLGQHWEDSTGHPIPLGGIIGRRSFAIDLAHKIDALIQESLLFAHQQPAKVMPYVQKHAQAMDEAVLMNHIQLYVNQYSESLGETGKKAVIHFFAQAELQGRVKKPDSIFFT